LKTDFEHYFHYLPIKSDFPNLLHHLPISKKKRRCLRLLISLLQKLGMLHLKTVGIW
jgi:hypothetical protein